MRVEITEKSLRTRDRENGKHYDLVEGDIVTVPDALGATWCARGWARDVEGVVPTGERRVIGAELAVDKVTHASRAKEV